MNLFSFFKRGGSAPVARERLLMLGGGTVFPPVMALGAVGSDSLAREVGRVIGREGRVEHRARGLAHHLAARIDQAHAGQFQRHIQSGIMLHGCPPSG